MCRWAACRCCGVHRLGCSDDTSGGVVGRRLVGGMQYSKKTDESLDLRWREILAIRRHVAAARHHFEAHLVNGEPRGDRVEGRTALAAGSADGVAVAAL